MRILITGGAGFIGSAVVDQAVAAGHEVLCLDKLTYAGSRENLLGVANAPNFTFVEADICDAQAVRAAFADNRPDAVLHLAAESHVDRSIAGPAEFIETNIVGTYTMLETALDHWRGLDDSAQGAFRFVHVSTDEVYGALGPTGEFHEDSPYRPNSPYSASKASSDMLARAWRQTFGLPALISNCTNNYGPRQYPEKLIPVIVNKAANGQPIPIYGDGSNVREWLYVDDHARALMMLAQAGEPGRIYLIGGGEEISNMEMARRICAIMDELRPDGAPHADLIASVTDRPGHDFRYALDGAATQRDLGWTPQTALDEGLERTVRWYLER